MSVFKLVLFGFAQKIRTETGFLIIKEYSIGLLANDYEGLGLILIDNNKK